MTRIILDFFGVTILAAIAFTAVEYFFGVNAPNGTVVSVIAAMVAGQLHGGRTGQEVSSGFAWRVAFVLTAISFTLLVIMTIGFQFLGESIVPADLSVTALLVILAIAGVIGVLIIRFTFRWAAKQGAKRSPKRADPEIFE